MLVVNPVGMAAIAAGFTATHKVLAVALVAAAETLRVNMRRARLGRGGSGAIMRSKGAEADNGNKSNGCNGEKGYGLHCLYALVRLSCATFKGNGFLFGVGEPNAHLLDGVILQGKVCIRPCGAFGRSDRLRGFCWR